MPLMIDSSSYTSVPFFHIDCASRPGSGSKGTTAIVCKTHAERRRSIEGSKRALKIKNTCATERAGGVSRPQRAPSVRPSVPPLRTLCPHCKSTPRRQVARTHPQIPPPREKPVKQLSLDTTNNTTTTTNNSNNSHPHPHHQQQTTDNRQQTTTRLSIPTTPSKTTFEKGHTPTRFLTRLLCDAHIRT